MKLTISEIAAAARGTILNSSSDRLITELSSDTRSIGNGDAYIALSGERFDGNDFVFQAVEKGAGLIILSDREKGEALATNFPLVPVIHVEDCLNALQEIASCWRRKLTGKVVFVTGSNGKTTTKEMIATVLKKKKRIAVTPENKNNLIGLPQTLLGVGSEDEVIVLEGGMNHEGEIRRLVEIAQPDIGLILNVAPAHIGYFGSIDAVCNAKWEMVDVMGDSGRIFVNGEDPVLAEKAEKFPYVTQLKALSENLEVKNVYVSKKGTTFEIIENDQNIFFSLNMIGKHFVSSVLATLAIAKEFGFTTQEVAEALKTFQGVKNRLSVRNEKEWEIINDAYNANPASMKAGIQAVHEIRNGIPTWYVLGNMGELGERSSEYHREIGSYIAERIRNDERKPSFIFVGNLGKDIGKALEEELGLLVPTYYCEDYEEATGILKTKKTGNTRVYLKASNSLNLYRVEEGLLN